jgi:ABC-type nitrate/sulfonate/bicarbonate transport system permease component
MSGIVAISLLGILFDSLLRLVHHRLDPTDR